MMALPIQRPCQLSLHHRYWMLCTHWQMWVLCSLLDEEARLLEQTRLPFFFRSVSSLALHLERSPPPVLRVPHTYNPCEMIFFFSWPFQNVQFP